MERIVVGVDGSAGAGAALRWAVEEAALRDGHVVALLAWSLLDPRPTEGSGGYDTHTEEKAAAALSAMIADIAPGQGVEERLVCDLPATALLDAGKDADLLVVGARGVGGFAGLLLGSVSERVLEHAPCAVAVVRDAAVPTTGAPVVVGIDGSSASETALRWAAAEARLRGATLRVVHAWHVPPTGFASGVDIYDLIERAARQVLDQALTDPALTGLELEGLLECMGAAQSLMKHARDASLVVTGTRGLGRFGRVVLGSTTRQLAHHATCPVAVIPQRDA